MLLMVFLFGVTFVHAQEVVEVGGPITGNTTWTNDYTYIVTSHLIVPAGIQLTIMPGVLVKFQVNQGLQIYGNLKVLGSYDGEIDTVRFMSYEGQIWKGISFNSVSGAGNNIIDYAFIDKATIGVEILYSTGVVVSHSRIQNGVANDLRIFNSSSCIITHNQMSKNSSVGLEIYASDADSPASDNQIINNYISDSRYTNLMVGFSINGVCRNNNIENNLFYGAEAGIYIDHSSYNSTDVIYIKGNVFYNNGGETIGFSISTGMDSTVITNNIFWQNTLTAVQLRRGKNNVLAYNSFYGNKNCISLSLNAMNVQIHNNTIVENSNYVVEINELNGLLMEDNNILNNLEPQGIVRNNMANPFDISRQYWGAADTLAIQEMIWDYFDDGSLGELSYLPFNTLADTTAPVSPPFHVISQFVSGNTRISWLPNPEADLSGYAVYSGDFVAYRFKTEPIILSDTSLLLHGNHLNKLIAVTAYDFGGPGPDQQSQGHESPFAFPTIYPYAGPDTAICVNNGSYTIQHTTIPFNYDELIWTSNGDGSFKNPQLSSPSYLPGPKDMENGCVILTLSVKVGRKILSDAFKLTLSSIPYVYAGSDTLVATGADLFLKEAEALHFEDLHWITMGDGSFVDSLLLNPVYLMGPLDIEKGVVELVLSAHSACGIVMDTIKVLIRNQFSVEGKVLSQSNPVSGSVVLAIYSMDGDVPQISQFTHSDSSGTFRFDKLFVGDYCFYALPDTAMNLNIMPAYYFGKQKWQSAYKLPLVANTYQVEIELPAKAYELPQGVASISGRFELPPLSAGIKNYCGPWFTNDYMNYCDGGLSNVTLILFNDKFNIPMDYTITDYEGRFIFNGLPYGKYIVDAEVPGYETTKSSTIELNREVARRDDITLRMEHNRKIGVYVPEAAIPERALIYPNPVKDIVYLNPNCADSQFEVRIFNVFGQQMIDKQYHNSSDHSSTLNVSGFSDGLYIGHFICNGFTQAFSFIVQH